MKAVRRLPHSTVVKRGRFHIVEHGSNPGPCSLRKHAVCICMPQIPAAWRNGEERIVKWPCPFGEAHMHTHTCSHKYTHPLAFFKKAERCVSCSLLLVKNLVPVISLNIIKWVCSVKKECWIWTPLLERTGLHLRNMEGCGTIFIHVLTSG